jgi:hypothetical protein
MEDPGTFLMLLATMSDSNLPLSARRVTRIGHNMHLSSFSVKFDSETEPAARTAMV